MGLIGTHKILYLDPGILTRIYSHGYVTVFFIANAALYLHHSAAVCADRGMLPEFFQCFVASDAQSASVRHRNSLKIDLVREGDH